ncbi:MAG: hypothetical protein AAF549_01020 [Pseudomonadota bacterium]
MNIDLFTTNSGEYGLIARGEFEDYPVGVLYDAETALLTIEFIKSDPFHCNINVDPSLTQNLVFCHAFYAGILDGNQIQETLRLPLMILNDPYKETNISLAGVDKPMRVLKHFDGFIKSSQFAQALHRDDLSDEGDSQSILKGANTKALEYSAKLQRQPLMEIGPKGPQVPQMSQEAVSQPVGPAPKGPGGASMGGSTARRVQRPPTQRESDED